MAAPLGAPLLRIRSLSKTFPGLRALDDIDLDVHAGEIVGLIGQNGSGKSTLVKTLAGIHDPDPGSVIGVIGADGAIDEDGDAIRRRLHFIHQDLGLVPTLTTVENIDLDNRYGARALWPSPTRAQREHARSLVARMGTTLDVDAPVGTLSASERTIVAIARALDGWSGADHVLVLDEPTAALPAREAERLFAAVKQLAAGGTGVIFISHHLHEVVDLADRVVALRGGRIVATLSASEVDHAALVQLIAGQQLAEQAADERRVGDEVLRVENLHGVEVDGVDLSLRAGEVVGVTGLLGSGREEIAGLIFGATPSFAGRMSVAGSAVPLGNPRRAIASGIGYVPADRAGAGAVMTMSARENLTLAQMRTVRGPLGSISSRAEKAEAGRWADETDLRPRDTDRPLGLFSGGNQQKIVLAKWLRALPRILLLDEPSQGVDVGASGAIYDLIERAAREGTAVLIASSDTKELAALCDRVLVMREGKVATEVSRDALTEERLLLESIGTGS
ncbi:sugar ABC transporter ATP-binding protein [Microbacterium sp. NPDC091313]